jgi:hypothetical protein
MVLHGLKYRNTGYLPEVPFLGPTVIRELPYLRGFPLDPFYGLDMGEMVLFCIVLYFGKRSLIAYKHRFSPKEESGGVAPSRCGYDVVRL